MNNQELDLNTQLIQLVQATCQCSPKSLERKQGLNEIILLMQQSGKIWRGNGSVDREQYQEALQQSWLYFCRNLCEATTVNEPYNPEKASVIYWFNSYLNYRIKYPDNISDLPVQLPREDPNTGKIIEQLENLPPPSDKSSSMIEEMQEWLKTDRSLSRIHVRDRPEINFSLLISRRLLQDQKFTTISKEVSVPNSTLSNFYNKRCIPRLKKWIEEQGYLKP